MDFTIELIIVIMAILILAAVGYLQLRYIRNKKDARLARNMEQDDAFNAVATTKAVASSLRQNGRDTTEADVLLYQAESAYERREFTKALDLAERARNALRSCKEKDLMTAPVPPTSGPKEEVSEVIEVEQEKASNEVPSTQVKKLPANYLESKFVIGTVKSMMDCAPDNTKGEAKGWCDQAEECFTKEEYTEALRLAMKAKRCLSGSPEPPKVVTGGSAPAPAPVIVEKTPDAEQCRKCGAAIGQDDEFCGACGTRKGERICPSCSRKAASEDGFCRKCGTKIDQ